MLTAAVFVALLGTLNDAFAFPAAPQVPLMAHPKPYTNLAATTGNKPRKLHGRFLHITDIHPDPYYKPHTSINKACHRKKPKKKKNRAGLYGQPFSECDSPFNLVDLTLDTLEKRWADQIDFVVWTGDSARHDNDRQRPRTFAEISKTNTDLARRMDKIFGKKGIPVVPSLGNNDIWPHNIMTPGPNSVTNEFSSIWKSFIPFPYHQVFQRGAYFSVEVIPDSVAVVSLNTLYFYDSNKAVGGCNFKEPDDPGNLELDWLEVQLRGYRERGMKVWLTGHVPPSGGNYFPECYVRYVELSLRFQDTILGHLYGHMNADHFFFIEGVDLMLVGDDPSLQRGTDTTQHDDLCDALLNDWSGLPKPGKADLDSYAVINVSPSVVPNPYLPTFRVFSYNITDSVEERSKKKKKKKKKKKGGKRKPGHHRGGHGDKTKVCKSEEYRDTWKCQLNDSWHSDPSAPSRTNTLWTPLGYAQYYIPDLQAGNKTYKPHFELEYATYDADGVRGMPKENLPKSLRKDVEKKNKYLPYQMPDLTIGSWYEFARRLGEGKERKLRERFRKYMYLGGEEG